MRFPLPRRGAGGYTFGYVERGG